MIDVGSVVIKEGSEMTVCDIKGEKIICTWFNQQTQSFETDSFALPLLKEKEELDCKDCNLEGY